MKAFIKKRRVLSVEMDYMTECVCLRKW